MATINNNNNNSSSASGSDPTTTHNTTFVQADPSTFRALVQKLTGVTENPSIEKLPVTTTPSRSSQTGKTLLSEVGPRKPGFKLHERRNSMRKLEIKLSNGSPFVNGGRFRSCCFNGGNENMFLVSPVSTLDFFCRGSPKTPRSPQEEEEKAIAEKGFYLHPSPLSTPRNSEPPELLPLFPLSSPRDSASSSSSSS
ncbi:VQ [Macleaya cordata]|uniref:VQ n=1 Tax=Macleaya cordata TaxID=56857 RepID=A0A200Q5V6_MACCD|nr:VQ [Macleaya cordata]